jgi:hypothetical protein
LLNNLAIPSVYIAIIADEDKAEEVFTIQNNIFFFASIGRTPTTPPRQHERLQLRCHEEHQLWHRRQEHRQQLRRHDRPLHENDSFILDSNCETRTLKETL